MSTIHSVYRQCLSPFLIYQQIQREVWIQSTPEEHPELVQGTPKEHPELVQGTPKEHPELVQGTPEEHQFMSNLIQESVDDGVVAWKTDFPF